MIKLILFSFLYLTQAVGEVEVAPQTFESMLCREWKVRFFLEGGVKQYPDAGEENDRFIFFNNHTMQIIEAGENQDALWEYIPSKEQLIITDRVSKEKRGMKITLLTKDELVLQIIDQDGSSSTIHLIPVK